MPVFLLRMIEWFRDRFDPIVYAPKPYISITRAVPLGASDGSRRLRLTFSNGNSGVLDLAQQVQFIGTLAPLSDPAFFRQAFVAHGTVCWPGDIDMDPMVLHQLTMGLPIDLIYAEESTPQPT